jgi:hypothetical protein
MTLIPLHVMGGAIAIVSGFVALYTLKGAQPDRKSGTIFVYAMLVMSLSGAVLAVGRAGAAMNIPAGLVTAYLVITSLLTVHLRPRDRAGWSAARCWRRSRSPWRASYLRS